VQYHNNKDLWDRAFAFLKDSDLVNLPTGKIELGDEMYVMVQEYFPKKQEDTSFETHTKYIDIQYVVSGEELIGLTAKKDITVTVPYKVEDDIEFGTAGDSKILKANAGRFFLFFPDDAHRPSIKVGEEDINVRKIVIKVPIK
jgi:YhcH/YjgK/YiaL family protein